MLAAVVHRSYLMPDAEALSMLGPLWALIGTLIALLVGALVFGRNWRIAAGTAIVGAIVTVLLSVRGFSTLSGGSWSGFSLPGGSPMLVVDQFSYFFMGLLATFLALVSVLWYLGHNAGEAYQPGKKVDSVEFFVLLVGSAFGMALMVSTTNLLLILLAVEMASLPSYAIVGFRKDRRRSAEASLKYVLFGAVTSAIMIYGVSLLYGQYGTLDLEKIGAKMAEASGGPSVVMNVSLVALMVGVAFKVSAVPFHFWCPDVFEGASIEVTTWLSVVSKAAGLGLLLRIMTAVSSGFPEGDLEGGLYWVVGAIAVMAGVTCTVGNLSAFWQTNLKRLLAYSSIAHAGYMLMLVASIGCPPANPLAEGAAHPAYSALAAYLVVYLFMNLGAFGIVAMVYWSTGKETIESFTGLGRRNPAMAAMMAVCMFSLIGLPPFGGFVAKWWLLTALGETGLWVLVFVAVFNTLISLYYYLRIVHAMYFASGGEEAPVSTPALGQALVAMCTIVIVLTGTFWAGKLKGFTDDRSRRLYAVEPKQEIAAVSDKGDRPEEPPDARSKASMSDTAP